MIGQKRYDFEAMREVWRMARDFNDIAVGEDERWHDFIERAKETDKRFPEFCRVVASIIKILEDRSLERYRRQEARS